MNASLQSLLSDIRQHPGFPELLKAVERPRAPRFKPNDESTAVYAARALHAEGQRKQHDAWLICFTGEQPQGID